ncbi:MAG TPA: hypothetical protein VK203_25975 [Nostocaceae cyanobacterium]|nr:hypothetical protein [Nostocaceae cyanobacterium]
MVRLVFMTILLLLLTACTSLALLPTYDLVQKAISLQVELTQKQLSQKLDLDLQKFAIKSLVITQETPLTLENLPAYHLRGTYNLEVKLPNRTLTQPQKTFDFYLQIQKEGKSWRLILPEQTNKDTQPVWRSYLVL